MNPLCIRCKGKGWCGKPCEILSKFIDKAPKIKMHFSGSSPPEIFVGRIGYPNVFSGILAPSNDNLPENNFQINKQNTGIMSAPEEWFSNNLSIEQILECRAQLIYGRSTGHIKSEQKLKSVLQEIAMASKSVSTEFFLKKKPALNFTPDKVFSIMPSPALVKKICLEENPRIEKKVDYLVNDSDVKAVNALQELYKAKIITSNLQKLLSAGLLGLKKDRKMVPTRWAITAVDDTLGKELLKKIRYYPEINQIRLFHYYYNGNHFEILLLPDKFAFEVIEVAMPGNVWTTQKGETNISYSQDYESFFGRKTYAKNVVGAYYTDRLAVTEYLEKIKKQASVLVLHEEREEYYAPLGVGIIRESIRYAMKEKPEYPSTIKDAFEIMSKRLKAPIKKYHEMSWVLNNYKKQNFMRSFNWVI